ALLARATDPGEAARRAVDAGAAVVLVDGVVPAGALGVDERLSIPIVGLPSRVARLAREALAQDIPVRVSLGTPGWEANDERGRIAPFSSHGLAFGGGVKPELAAAGVEILTADVGRTEGRQPRYGTVSGSSAAAAIVGGAAALVAQARPGLDAEALKGVLVGTAVALGDTPTSAQGAGLVDPGAAAVAEVAAAPATVAFGAATEQGWTSVRRVRVRNVTNRRLRAVVAANVEGIAGVSVTVRPSRLLLRAGAEREIELTARVTFVPQGLGAIAGTTRVEVAGGGEIAIPWAVAFPAASEPLLGDVRISTAVFRASDRAPAVLQVRAGSVSERNGRAQLQPLERLDVELWQGAERIGLLARLRDVLPGNYAFGVTGRGPRGGSLERGRYRLRVLAVPPDGLPEATAVRFRIR
ncbi:MAG: S8 family serine peptidase, partial [Actinobacteria bacterium]|nr:S8 family serine peptidase [Actinomycetota bacterium]